MRAVARNAKTGEVRAHEIDGRRCNDVAITGEVFTEIYKALGIFDQLWLGAIGSRLISQRSPQGWPVYSRIIPWLYDFMVPYYASPGRYSEKIDTQVDGKVERLARYPTELLSDMLTILKMHHPNVFGQTTRNQLKAAISRHLSRKLRHGAPTS